jgi:alpha-1,6-mannosyltransferase
MKSLHLTNAWHAESGGIATHYRSLLAEAERQRRDVALIVPGAANGITIRGTTRIHTVAAGKSVLNDSYRMIVPNRWPGVNGRVAEIVRQEQPDLIEVCDKYSLHYLAGLIRKGYFKGLSKRPVLIGMSCERMDDNLRIYLTKSKWGEAFARWYTKWIYFGFFDHHIVNSQHVAAELREASRGHVTERGIWVRPPGVELGEFGGAERDESWRRAIAPGGARIVLYAGRLAPEKNLDLLIDTFALLVKRGAYKLVVAGDGIERERLEARAEAEFPGKARFLGYIGDRKELARIYASADVFVHPNPAEPFGIAPLEAMASGLAFVGPASGGILTYSDSTNAWLTQADPESFAQAVEDTFGPGRESRITAAREMARRYHAREASERLLRLYEEFVTRGTATGADYISTPGTWLGFER